LGDLSKCVKGTIESLGIMFTSRLIIAIIGYALGTIVLDYIIGKVTPSDYP